MKILDINGNIINQEDYRLEMGKLIEEKLFVAHHPAQEYVEEQGHYETIAEYANGGRTVRWVIDVPGQQETLAWDEYEDIQRLVPYTDKEKAMFEIEELKSKLLETDYNIIKIVEGAATKEEMSDVIDLRANWRFRINELQRIYEL